MILLQGILKVEEAPTALATGDNEDEEDQKEGKQREVDQNRLRLYEQAKLR